VIPRGLFLFIEFVFRLLASVFRYGGHYRRDLVISGAGDFQGGLKSCNKPRHQGHRDHKDCQEHEYRTHSGQHQGQPFVDQFILHIEPL